MYEQYSPYNDDPEYDPRAPKKSEKLKPPASPPTLHSVQERTLYDTLTESEFTPAEALMIVTRWRNGNVFKDGQ